MKTGWWILIGGTTVTVSAGTAYLIQQKNLLQKTEIKPFDWKFNKIGSDELNITLILALRNFSDANYIFRKQKYNIYVNKNYLSTTTLPKAIQINPESIKKIPIEIKFRPLSAIQKSGNAMKELFLNKTDSVIRIKGNAKVDAFKGLLSINYPIDVTFKLSDIILNFLPQKT